MDRCVPGDVIVVSGEVRVNSSVESKREKDSKSMFLIYIKANCVATLKDQHELLGNGNYCSTTMYGVRELIVRV